MVASWNWGSHPSPASIEQIRDMTVWPPSHCTHSRICHVGGTFEALAPRVKAGQWDEDAAPTHATIRQPIQF